MEPAVYRVRCVQRREGRPKGYRHSLELLDEATQQVAARCDLTNHGVRTELPIRDELERTWTMAPNRKIMPSHWIVTDPAGHTVMAFDQKALNKLANPLYRVALCLLDAEGREFGRVVDPRTGLAGRILGAGPGDWCLVDGDAVLAKLVRLPRPHRQSTGLLGAWRSFMAGSDPGIVSTGRRHLLPAPAALAMQVLLDELTDVSGGTA